MEQYINKAEIVAQANNEITLLRIAQEEGILTEYGKGMLEGLEGIVDFINTLETKDIDEIIKNAEDHAYFAGSENTREKLIDKACNWWEVELTYPSMTPDEIKRHKNRVRKFRKDMEDK